jgi:hypothetical protein
VTKNEANKEFKTKISILAVSYHNLGVEQEFLKMFKESLSSYREALALSDRYLGSEDSITINLRDTFRKAEKAIEEQRRQ